MPPSRTSQIQTPLLSLAAHPVPLQPQLQLIQIPASKSRIQVQLHHDPTYIRIQPRQDPGSSRIHWPGRPSGERGAKDLARP